MEKSRGSILIVDDDKFFCDIKVTLLERNNYKVCSIQEPSQALERLAGDHFDLVLLDLKIGQFFGIDVLQKIKKFDPDIVVIMITAFEDVGTAVEAIKKGAYDYLTKKIDDDELLIKIEKAVDKYQDSVEIRNLKGALGERFGFSNIIGADKRMKEIYVLVKDVCDTDATILIHGETGTGKELIAKSIHFNSLRKDKPFVAVNCAAISEHLMESELFGHEKGAFTDAHKQRIGRVETANGGSLFLDEIGDMGINLQAKLLRFLQDKTFERVGGNEKMTSDVRVIAATNKELPQMVKDGKFREDLYFRLNVVNIEVPPLRDRLDDIDLLAEHLIKQADIRYRKQLKGITKDALNRLKQYPWPGNVRELENLIDRIALTAKKDLIEEEDVSSFLKGFKYAGEETALPSMDLPLREARAEFEKRYLLDLLKRYSGSINKISEKSGMDRKSIFLKLQQYGIEKKDFKD